MIVPDSNISALESNWFLSGKNCSDSASMIFVSVTSADGTNTPPPVLIFSAYNNNKIINNIVQIHSIISYFSVVDF